jgi:hypothetical protein
MKEHILLEKAHRYTEQSVVPVPGDCVFQEKRGYWIKCSTNEIMMLSSSRPLLQSKKCDRETGEDQKGE